MIYWVSGSQQIWYIHLLKIDCNSAVPLFVFNPYFMAKMDSRVYESTRGVVTLADLPCQHLKLDLLGKTWILWADASSGKLTHLSTDQA